MAGVTFTEKNRNTVVRMRCGVEENVVTNIEKGMIRWFGNVEKMNDRILTKQI